MWYNLFKVTSVATLENKMPDSCTVRTIVDLVTYVFTPDKYEEEDVYLIVKNTFAKKCKEFAIKSIDVDETVIHSTRKYESKILCNDMVGVIIYEPEGNERLLELEQKLITLRD